MAPGAAGQAAYRETCVARQAVGRAVRALQGPADGHLRPVRGGRQCGARPPLGALCGKPCSSALGRCSSVCLFDAQAACRGDGAPGRG